MRPYSHRLQRCLGGALHNSPLFLASASSRSSGSGGGRGVAAAAPPNTIEDDGKLLRSTENRYGGAAGSRRHQRRTPAQLLANHGGGGSQGAVSDAVSPVERLLKKHEVSPGGGTANAIPVPSKSRSRVKNGLVAPPTRAEEPSSGGGSGDDGDDLGGALSLSPSATPAAKQQQLLTNPFRGLHADVTRSYRVDQLREVATAADLMLARQEKKSTAFSFLHFRAGERFYQGHWESVVNMQAQLDAFTEAAQTTLSKRISRPYLRGTPIPGLTLFNNDLGLQSPLVQCSYPLIVAQRLLLFPDHLRHFHTICGRENVPCDFYADIDLPGESTAGAEKTLLEVLNYLEVRLPGVGFTDPFFLVLTNAVPSRDKVSYHIHARSFTHMKNRPLASSAEASTSGRAKRRPARKRKAKAAAAAAAPADRTFGEDDIDEEHDEDPYDDLSDMVSAVDVGGKGSASSRGGSAATPKVVAFQDYRAVKLIADEVNQTVGRDVVDHNCYRTNGMLRCAFSAKMPSAQDHNYHQQTDNGAAAARKRLVPLVTASDPALQQRLSETESVLRTMTDPEVLELTFVTRHLDADPKVIKAARKHAVSLLAHERDTPAESAEQLRRAAVLDATTKHRLKLIRPRQIMGPQATQAVEYDAYGNVVPPFLTEAAKWRRFKAVTAKLRTLPPRAAESYDVWVRVGLALHNFSNEDHVFEEWVRFSLKSPLKYSREVCRKKWVQFERNPDALNWRRGFNYLNSTVWRQV